MEKEQNLTDEWIKKYGIRYFNEMTNTILLVEEVGEFCRYVARVYGEQSFKKSENSTNIKETFAEELADIQFILFCLANQMEINLEKAFYSKLEKKTIRDKERHFNNPKLT